MTQIQISLERGGGADQLVGQPVRPTVFIGLGGSGLKVLARVRRNLYERFGDPDFWPIYRFLGIDSHAGDILKGGVEAEKGLPIAPRDLRSIGMTVAQIQRLLEGLKGTLPHFGKWMPDDVASLGSTGATDGASQMRTVGRMLFLWHVGEIISAIRARCGETQDRDNISQAIARGAVLPGLVEGGAPPTDIVIVGSIGGGTGAGCFLDCAYLARALAVKRLANIGDIHGLLMLPDIFDNLPINGQQKRRILANGYAALRELEYFNGRKRRAFPTEAWGDELAVDDLSEPPFQVTYLFSRDNGSKLSDSSEVYDLIADALAFSASGTPLASHMRGAWSNAKRGSYLGSLRSTLPAETSDQGGDPNAAPNTYVRYQKISSTRYSSLGISTITMKIPELRRLAAVRLLQQLIAWEIGEEPKSTPALRQSVEQAIVPIANTTNLLGDLRDKLRRKAARIAASAQAVEEAESGASKLEVSLRALANGVDNPALAKLKTTKDLLAHANHKAEKDAAQVAGAGTDYDYRRRLRFIDEVISYLQNDLAKEVDAVDGQDWSTSLRVRQWRDLDRNGSDRFFSLDSTARGIIRRGLADELASRANQYAQHMGDRLGHIYRVEVARLLKEEKDRVQAGISDLAPWREQLDKIRVGLVRHFKEARNTVLTERFIHDPSLLDAEIERVLRDQDLVAEEHVDNSAVRTWVMAALAKALDLGEGPATLLGACSEVAPQHARVLETMVDVVATRLLSDLPQEKDVFRALEIGNVDTELNKVANRARAYWPLDDSMYRTTVDDYRLAGAIVPEQETNVIRRVKEWFTELHKGDWEWLPSNDSRDGAPVGELVVVHEAHGYSLLSLLPLTEMRDAYDRVANEGDSANRHIDKRLRAVLGDLRPMRDKGAFEEMGCWDIALLGIQLGIFRWSKGKQTYQFSPDQHRHLDCGTGYESIASWLREKGLESRQAIENKITMWFRRRVERSETEPLEERAAKLIDLDLVLELLGVHVFTRAEDDRSPPPHTMTRRIRFARVRKRLRALENRDEGLAERMPALRRDRALALQGFVEFVGPAHERVLRPLFGKRNEEDYETVALEEAWNLGWFPGYDLAEDLRGFFPDYAEDF